MPHAGRRDGFPAAHRRRRLGRLPALSDNEADGRPKRHARQVGAGHTNLQERARRAHQRRVAADSSAPYLKATLTISYDLEPFGVVTSTVSPTFLPMTARARGEVIDSRLAPTSASSGPTIW